MIYNIISSFMFILLAGTITSVILVILKKLPKKYLITVPALLLYTLFTFLINYDYDVDKEMNIVVKGDNDLNLTIYSNLERSYLINLDTLEEIEYKTTWRPKKEQTQNDLNAVYIKDLDPYYLVIFSEDKDRTYSDRFTLGDHERDRGDLLYLIDKEDGYMYPVSSNELSGYEIDLTTFTVSDELVYYGVYLKYEDNISHYRYLYIPDDMTLEMYGNISFHNNRDAIWISGVQSGSVHLHTLGDPSNIELFDAREGRFVYIDTYGKIILGSYKKAEYDVTFSGSDLLTGQTNILLGYYDIVNGKLYYVSNELNLYRFDSNYAPSVPIRENVTLDNWQDFIPTE